MLFEQNTVRRNTGSNSHILMSEGPGHANWTIRNNVFDTIGSHGIITGKPGEQGIQNALIYNNTFVNVGGLAIQCGGGTKGKMANNIFYAAKQATFSIASSSSCQNDYNLTFAGAALPSEAHGLKVDPLFVNQAGDDFHLKPGSPAINAGDNSALVPVRTGDFEGNPVAGTVDIGAYEHP